ncbi:hypothetical protein NPIL_597381 [Nephila pilipes]|uniref:Uncharacterized protein n=1 Tax=Nephila pilipes TaxID=299642 RepID=A0A8X6Q418_NEPPI|nr:hypothetical protein NPIL_597381 [Nephila pilipes]
MYKISIYAGRKITNLRATKQGSRQPSSDHRKERCIRIKLGSTYDLRQPDERDWDTAEVRQRDSYKEAGCSNSNHLSIDGFLNRNFSWMGCPGRLNFTPAKL